MWIDEAVLYQIYPLGFCGAPWENDGIPAHRLDKVRDWIPHLKRLGVDGVYFSPLFESDRHGYDTRDFFRVDTRLGTNDDLKSLCRDLHENGIRVIFDGVFNHVGRGFPQFRDVLEKREMSPYRDWFFVNFDGNNAYGDGLWYEGWEGHFELVKLNLRNPAVRDYLFGAVRFWVEEFGIDGLRLDVAYSLDRDFLAALRAFCDGLKPDFPLIGEVLFGDYNLLVNDRMLHSCTNYENYKSLYSAINSENLWELSYSLNRQFGPEQWCIYRGKHLLTFLDNHDVTRIASILKDADCLLLAWVLLLTEPGVPTIYYGSEWGMTGRKEDGDPALRPCPEAPEWNALTEQIASLIRMRKSDRIWSHGGYRNLAQGNRALTFARELDGRQARVTVDLETHAWKIEG